MLFVAKRYAEMFGDIPVREQIQFPAQQCFIVGRKFVLFRRKLNLDQSIRCSTIKLCCVTPRQSLQVGGVAKIGQQQETLRQVLCIYMRHMRAGILEQLADMQERLAIFVLRRGIHHYFCAAIRESSAEIAAETGIGRSGGEGEGFFRVEAEKPVGKLLLTLHLIALMVDLCDFSTLIYSPHTMHFRFLPIAFLLPGLFPLFGHAEDAALPLKMDRTFKRHPASSEETAAFINARHVEAKKDDQLEAYGDVELRQNGQVVKTEHLLYGQASKDVLAEGSVRFEQGGLVVTGPVLKLNLDSDMGEMSQPKYEFSENHARGTAKGHAY